MCLKLFLDDPETDAIIMIGEIGGSAEEDGAEFLIEAGKRKKPVVGFIAGRPPRPAGAWATPAPSSQAAKAAPKHKIEAMREAGIVVANSPAALGTTLARLLNDR